MSSARLRVVNAQVTVGSAVSVPTTAHEYKCGRCNRAAMVETNGLIVIRQRHDNEAHPTAYKVDELVCELISRATPSQVKKIEAAVVMRMAALSMGAARPRESETRMA